MCAVLIQRDKFNIRITLEFYVLRILGRLGNVGLQQRMVAHNEKLERKSVGLLSPEKL